MTAPWAIRMGLEYVWDFRTSVSPICPFPTFSTKISTSSSLNVSTPIQALQATVSPNTFGIVPPTVSWSKTKVFGCRRIHSIRFAEWCTTPQNGSSGSCRVVSMDWSARMWSGEEVGGLVRAVVVGDLDSGPRGSGKAFVGWCWSDIEWSDTESRVTE